MKLEDLAEDVLSEEERILVNDEFRIVDITLPKKCGCGRNYETELEVINRTKEHSYVQDTIQLGDEEEESALAYYRHCACHSTLVFPLESKDFKQELKKMRTHFSEQAKDIKELFDGFIVKRKNPLEELSHSSLLGHIFQQLQREDVVEFTANPCSTYLTEEDWTKVARNIFRDKKNFWVREHQSSSPYKVLVIDNKQKENSFLETIDIPETEVVYSSSLTEARERFKENPEGLSLVVIDLSKNYNQRVGFLGYIREHDGEKNTDSTVCHKKKIFKKICWWCKLAYCWT